MGGWCLFCRLTQFADRAYVLQCAGAMSDYKLCRPLGRTSGTYPWPPKYVSVHNLPTAKDAANVELLWKKRRHS